MLKPYGGWHAGHPQATLTISSSSAENDCSVWAEVNMSLLGLSRSNRKLLLLRNNNLKFHLKSIIENNNSFKTMKKRL